MDCYVARQPIYDGDERLFAYDLLYRTSADENWASGVDTRTMSSDVIIHSVLNTGLERITGGARAILSFTSDMLVTDLYELINRDQVIIKLVGSAAFDDYSLRACERLTAAGYVLSLDDLNDVAALDPVLRLAKIVKVDMLTHTPDELARLVDALRPYHAKLVAKRVENAEMDERARALGFDLYQGYYYARPEILRHRDVPTDDLSIIRLLTLLRDPDTSDAQLAEAFSVSPALCFQLLRIVSSASPRRHSIESLPHAIRLVSRDMLHRWLSLLFGSSLVRRSVVDRKRMLAAVTRARLCQSMGLSHGHGGSASSSLYLVGLVSALDGLLQMPLADVLEKIDLAPDVKEALLDARGPFAQVLELVRRYEAGDWDKVPVLAAASAMDAEEVNEMYVQSLTWSRARLQQE